MKAGAIEFLTKPFNDDLAEQAQMQELRKRYASLTPREREVMSLVVSGLLNKQIGGELGISEITVKAHRGQVMHKMKANSVADLVRMAGKLHGSTALEDKGDQKAGAHRNRR